MQVVGAVGPVDILGFEIGRRRQDDIGIARRHRQKRVVHDREQILAHEPLPHLAGLGAGHRRIIGGDEQPADRRITHVQQRLAEPQMVDRPCRCRPRRFADPVVVPAIGRNRQQQRAAAPPSIGAGDARQQCHGAQCLAAARQPRHALAKPDKRALRRAIELRQPLDVARGETRDLGNPLRRKFRQYLRFEPAEADRLGRDVIAVGEPIAHQDMHDPERQCRVGADPDLQVPIGKSRRAALARIDDDDLDATLLRGFRLCPEMHIRCDEVGAPGDDQVAFVDRFGVGAADRPDGHVPRLFATGVADGPGNQAACAERMKEPEHEAAVELSLMRAVGVAEKGQGPGFGDDRFPPPGDLVERRVPADRREFSVALGPDPAQRGFEALRRMHEFGVAVDLGAGKTRGEGLFRVALDP